jgi:hypothetical protein
MNPTVPLLGTAALVAVHLLADRVHSRDPDRRARLLSFAGGASVAFVFMHILPELGRGQATVDTAGVPLRWIAEHAAYMAALIGLLVYYGAEHAAAARISPGGRPRDAAFFHTHIGLFFGFNVLVGYLLVREWERLEPASYGVLWLAFALHLFANDFALRGHHREEYHRSGRWILASGVVAGWAAGWLLPVGDAGFTLALAFVAGGIVLNTLKEEMPGERNRHFGAFLTGTTAIAVLFLVL